MTHVLVVDDDRMVLEVLQLLYSIHPMVRSTSGARTYDEALMVLRSCTVDIVSIDIDLGRTTYSGFDLCRTIRRTVGRVFITICSADGTPDNRRIAEFLGAHSFLQKPVNLSDIGRLMDEYEKWRSNPKSPPGCGKYGVVAHPS